MRIHKGLCLFRLIDGDSFSVNMRKMRLASVALFAGKMFIKLQPSVGVCFEGTIVAQPLQRLFEFFYLGKAYFR